MSSPSVVEDFEMFTSGVGQNRAALSLNSLFRAADQESPRKGSSARPHTFRKHIVGYCMAVLALCVLVPVAGSQTPPVNLCVFDDGYSNMEGPSDAIFISGRNTNNEMGKACIPGGQFGHCHKWFGRCGTPNSVFFYVFDDERGNSIAGPADAVYIPTGGNQACIPDGTATGSCRRWFGQIFTGDGRNVRCDVFDDQRGSTVAGPSDAIYVSHPIPSPGDACIPDGTSNGSCRRWFGQCRTTESTPIAYREVITGPPGWPSGTLGNVMFGGSANNVKLKFSYVGDTAHSVPFAVAATPCQDGNRCVNNGTGFENIAGTATIAIEDAGSGALLTAGNFRPEAGVFVSVDDGNSGIGFGSKGALPTDPSFPNRGVEVAYPYALFGAPLTDLQSNYTFPFSFWAMSCAGFSGSPGQAGPPGSTCNAPLPLDTTGGTLTIISDNQVNPSPTGSFSATTTFYTLSVPPLTPSPIRSQATATSTISINPFGGFSSGQATLGCKTVAIDAVSGGSPLPTCSLSNAQIAVPGTATLTVATSTQTPTGTYAVIVTGESAGQPPGNGAQTVTFTVLKSGGGIVALVTFACLLGLWNVARPRLRKRLVV